MINGFKKYWNQIKTWFWALPVWKRSVVTSVIGAFGGSSAIGFFNKYALYYHAYIKGFRIPVEGVEYIDLAVTLVSFVFIIISIAGTILIYNILNFTAKLFTRLLAKKATESNKMKFFNMINIIITLLGAIASIIKSIQGLKKGNLQIPPLGFTILFVIFVVLLIGFIFKRNDSGRRLVTLTIVFSGIFFCAISLFNQNVYSSFLKVIRYGGELPLTIEYRKADNTAAVQKGMLLIRTNSAITIKNEETGNIEEIPAERVSKIIYQNSLKY